MSRLGSTATPAILLVVSAAYHLPALFQPLVMYDEGVVLCGAERVLRGELPYRDFWTIYAPGQFYTLALFFGAFGKTVLVERLYDLIVRCLVSLIVFLILRECARLRVALVGWGVSVVWIQFFGSPGYSLYPFLLFFLASVFFLLRQIAREQRLAAPMAGVMMGLAILFRQLLGAMSALLMLVSIWAFFWAKRFDRQPLSETSGAAGRTFGRIPIGFLLCMSLPPLVVLGVLAVEVGLPGILDQLVVFPLTKFGEYRSLPYPSMHLLLPPRIESWSSLATHLQQAILVLYFYLFPAFCALGFVANAVVITREKKISPITCVSLYLCLAGLGFLRQATARSELLHLLPCGLTAILAAFTAYENFSAVIRTQRWIKLASIVVVIYLLYPTLLWCKTLSEARFEAVAPLSESYRTTIDFVRERTPGEDQVFVGVYNHDRLVANYVSLYFLLGKGYGTRYHELHPGVITTERVQKEVASEMERNDVQYVLLTSGWWSEPNRSRTDAGVDYLDEFIRSRFERVLSLRNIEVWARSQGGPSRERQ